MITPTEIRKGLYFNVPRKDQCPFRIDVIEHLSDNYAKVGMTSGVYKHGNFEIEGHPLTWELKDLQPIPLTEDILLKCGFKKYISGSWCVDISKDAYIAIDINFENGTWLVINNQDKENSVKLVKVKYLHQLQNLYFALTGEELQVNL